MKNRNNNRGRCDNEVNRVWKPLHKRTPDTASYLWKLKRILGDAFHERVKSQGELASQSRSLTLVP